MSSRKERNQKELFVVIQNRLPTLKGKCDEFLDNVIKALMFLSNKEALSDSCWTCQLVKPFWKRILHFLQILGKHTPSEAALHLRNLHMYVKRPLHQT